MKTQSLPLIAFLPPAVEEPSFITPVFGSDEKNCYLQVIKDQKQVVAFEPLTDPDESTLSPLKMDLFVTVGQDAVFAFRFGPNDVVLGQREILIFSLRRRLAELNGFPFARLSVASFLGDGVEIEKAINSASAELCAANRDLAVDWHTSMDETLASSRGDVDRTTASWADIHEFTLALLKFCRAQRFLAFSRSSVKRRWALMEYNSTFEGILPFFFNTKFLRILRQKLKDVNQEPSRFELSLFPDIDERLTSLTRLGMSRRTARRLLNEMFTSGLSDDRSLSNRDMLNLIFKADRLIRNQVELSRKLDVTEKAIRKRHLKVGTISIAYGLVLLLRNHANETGLTDSRIDELALAAIRSGLKNCAPTTAVREESWEFNNLFAAPEKRSRLRRVQT
jgi:hypothetical protein